MKKARTFSPLRRFLSVASTAIGVGLVWGLIGAIAARIVFNLDEVSALAFVGLPVGVFVIFLLWKRIPAALGFDD